MLKLSIKPAILLVSVLAVWLFALIVGNSLWTLLLADKFVEKPYLTYKNLPFPVLQKQVFAGEIIPILVIRCNDTEEMQNYNTTRALENVVTKENFLLEEQRLLIKPGCTQSESRVNKIPPTVPPGKYYIYGTAEVRGHSHFLILDWRTQEFEVIKK